MWKILKLFRLNLGNWGYWKFFVHFTFNYLQGITRYLAINMSYLSKSDYSLYGSRLYTFSGLRILNYYFYTSVKRYFNSGCWDLIKLMFKNVYGLLETFHLLGFMTLQESYLIH